MMARSNHVTVKEAQVDEYLKLLLDPSLTEEQRMTLRQQIFSADTEAYQLKAQAESLQKLRNKKNIREKSQHQKGKSLLLFSIIKTRNAYQCR